MISAVGIVGNVEGLGLEALGVKLDRTHVVVDEFCRTGVDGLYAIGDVAGPPWLAHKAMHEGVVVAELIAGGHPHPVRPEAIAGCTYCAPQIASVGLTEAKAKEAGHEVRVGRFPFLGNGKAIALGDPEGLVKTVFDARTGELLGAHMIGPEVTELIQGYVIGRTLETTEAELIETVFPHPTLSRGDARGGARRLRADAALLNGQSGAASSTCSLTRPRPPKPSCSSRPARCAAAADAAGEEVAERGSGGAEGDRVEPAAGAVGERQREVAGRRSAARRRSGPRPRGAAPGRRRRRGRPRRCARRARRSRRRARSRPSSRRLRAGSAPAPPRGEQLAEPGHRRVELVGREGQAGGHPVAAAALRSGPRASAARWRRRGRRPAPSGPSPCPRRRRARSPRRAAEGSP